MKLLYLDFVVDILLLVILILKIRKAKTLQVRFFICYFYYFCNQIPNGRFYSSLQFKGMCSTMAGKTQQQRGSQLSGSKVSRKWAGYKTLRPTPSESFSEPLPPKRSTISPRSQVFKHINHGGHFILKVQQILSWWFLSAHSSLLFIPSLCKRAPRLPGSLKMASQFHSLPFQFHDPSIWSLASF